ncbi:MAG: SRPBCC family protein [Acidimicrobiia bacterium]|nr:SRPBCC family protein [Acidimicrobiia bacterium]
MSEFTPTPGLDLVLERTIPVPIERVWAAWTEPELLMQWFTPAPWKTVAADLDVRPGGRCNTTMESPEGERYPNTGCYLEVEPNRLLVFTSVMTEGFRPAAPANGADDLPFTGRIELTATADGGTHYRAIAIHADEAGANRHAEMGFHDGWGAALDQLVALVS